MKYIFTIASFAAATYFSSKNSAEQMNEQQVPQAIGIPIAAAIEPSEPIVPHAQSMTPVAFTQATSQYNIRNNVVFRYWEVDNHLKGVIAGKAHKIMQAAQQNGICPYFMTAVIMHESANGTSRLAKANNNICGIYKNGKYVHFDSVDDCIDAMAALLAGRIYAKCKTVSDVQKIYCPIGANNDAHGMNKHWKDGVVHYMNKISSSEIPVKINYNA